MTGSRPHQVRLLGGRWKRTPLRVIEAAGLRPTPQRVRETVFDWLMHAWGGSLDGIAALDLYAGTGALGLEAASRGAAAVTLVERDPRVVDAIEAIRTRLAADRVQVLRGDAAVVGPRLHAAGRRFDVVFVDPPFGRGMLATALPLARSLCAADALIYVESEAAVDEAIASGLGCDLHRADRAGDVFYHLLRCKNNDR